MAFEIEQREARRLLESIEGGRTDPADAFARIEQADPALVHVVVSWLRRRYAHHSAGDAVIGRIVEICQAYPATTQILRRGAADPIVEWFEETYDYGDLDADELLRIVVEKLEG